MTSRYTTLAELDVVKYFLPIRYDWRKIKAYGSQKNIGTALYSAILTLNE